MITNCDPTKQLGARSNIDMPADSGHATPSRPERDLLKNEAVHANDAIIVDHDAVGMGE
jgi:hypothetical protein